MGAVDVGQCWGNAKRSKEFGLGCEQRRLDIIAGLSTTRLGAPLAPSTLRRKSMGAIVQEEQQHATYEFGMKR
jgi:hypothetical protein